jgi:hypothetical protein
MTTKRPRARTRPRSWRVPSPAAKVLERRLARLEAVLAAERARAVRRAAALRRAADRRLATMMRELAALRHHEARAEALARLLAERDGKLAAQAARIARLESLLHGSTPNP